MSENNFKKPPFTPQVIDVTAETEGEIEFGFVPHQVKEADFGKEWWPRLKGFPLNIMYASTRQEQDKVVVGSALYEPDLETFRETETARELTYRNKYGGNYSVCVSLKKGGGIETFKYEGQELIASAIGGDFDRAMWHTTIGGLHKGERCRFETFKN